jgi:hypothetical protein
MMTQGSAEIGDRACRASLRWAIVGLVVVFLGLNAGLLWIAGVQLGGDSSRYIGGVEGLLAGRLPGGYGWTYAGYIAVVAVMQVIGAGLPGVVGLQIGVAGLAGLAVASLGATLGGPLAGVVGGTFLLVNPDVIQWHRYILTDSLYTSAVVIVVWVLWRAAERRGWWYGRALLVLLPASMLRPTGLLLLPVAAAFWGVRGALARDWIGVALGVIGIVGTVLLVFSPSVHDTAGKLPGYTLRSGRVIYQQSAFQVEMPADVTSGGAGWLADLGYVGRHPGSTLALGARRVAVELAHVRPYYRIGHNGLIVAVLLPLYTLAAIGIAATWRHPLTHLLLVVIAAHMLLVAVALADYDGRFLVHVLGPFGVLAAAGFGKLIGTGAVRTISGTSSAPTVSRPS